MPLSPQDRRAYYSVYNGLINVTLDEYIEAKIDMITEDFCLKPSKYELARLRACKTEVSADIVCSNILKQHLEEYAERTDPAKARETKWNHAYSHKEK